MIHLFKPFSYINDISGVSGIPYSSTVFGRDLYLTTSEGVFYSNLEADDLSNTSFQKIPTIQSVVWSIKEIDKKLYCGADDGAYVIENGKSKKLANSGTWLFVPLKRRGVMLSGTYEGLNVWQQNNGLWVLKNHISGFAESSRFVVEDKLGDIWVSHGNKGVYKLRLNAAVDSVTHVKIFNSINGLPQDFDNCVYKIGEEIVITSKAGVYRYDTKQEEIVKYDALSKILGNDCHIEKIHQFNKNLFFVIYNYGAVAKIKLNQNDSFTMLWKNEKLKGLFVGSYESLYPISENILLLNTQNGFVSYAETLKSKLQKPSIIFRSFVASVDLVEGNSAKTIWEGHSVQKNSIKDFNYKENAFVFRFSSNRYEDEHNIQYQYYLTESNIVRWSGWTTVPLKEYNNLKPGSYEFQVRAKNTDGNISETDHFNFVILPPWYFTAWAYIAYTILFGIGVSIYARWIMHRFKRQKISFEKERNHSLWVKEKEIEEATIKAEKEIMRLEQEKLQTETNALQQKEILLEQDKKMKEEDFKKSKMILELEREKFENELKFKNQELSSLTLHMTQKNETFSKLKSQINKIIRQTPDQSMKENLVQLELMIQKGMNSSKEWEKFKEYFDDVHGNKLKRLKEHYPDLKTSSLKLCAYLKMGLSSKQISILMNTTSESVVKARYRLRTRLNLDKGQNLTDFLNNF
jgi:hypothetical protein